MRRPISSPFQSFREPYISPFAKTPFGFVRPNSEGPIVLSPFLRNPYGRFPTQVRIKPEFSAKDHLISKAISVSAMRRPISSPFRSFREPYISPFAKTPFGFVRPNSEGPIVLSPFLRNPYGRFSHSG